MHLGALVGPSICVGPATVRQGQCIATPLDPLHNVAALLTSYFLNQYVNNYSTVTVILLYFSLVTA